MDARQVFKALFSVAFWTLFIALCGAFIFTAGCTVLFFTENSGDYFVLVIIPAGLSLLVFTLLYALFQVRPGVVALTEDQRNRQNIGRATLLILVLGLLTFLLNSLGNF